MIAGPPLKGVERLVLAALCLATLLFAAITPPFQAPDEDQHYMKSVLLSQGRLLGEARGGTVGADLPRDAVALMAGDFDPHAEGAFQLYDGAMLRRAWDRPAAPGASAFAAFPNVANYAPTLYAPQATGVLVGEAVGLPRLGGFYLGRAVNALTALLLLGLALAALPFGRLALLAIAALPTTCYQAGSLSPDATIHGLGFLALALSLRVGHAAAGRAGGALLAIAPFATLAKGVYLPLLLAGLPLPPRWRDRRLWIIVLAILLGIGAFLAWTVYSGATPALYSIASRKTGDVTTTAPLSAQLAVVLADPLAYLRILVTSHVERLPVYALQIVGRFGWNAILLPLLAYPLALLMLASAVAGGTLPPLPRLTRLWWLLLAIGGIALVETALYLTGTPYAADYVQGVQGRYLLPFLPLILIALTPPAGFQRAGAAAQRVMAGASISLLAVALLTALDSFWVRGFTTGDGMPPMQGLARALVLPSPRW